MEEGRSLFVTVCDEVRHEVGQKLSFMGIYEQTIFLKSFPATLPKLAFVMKARTPSTKPFQRLRFRVLRDNDVIAESDISEDAMATLNKNLPPLDDPDAEVDGSRITLTIIAAVSPMHFVGPGKFKFRLETESEELKGDALLVRQAPENTVVPHS